VPAKSTAKIKFVLVRNEFLINLNRSCCSPCYSQEKQDGGAVRLKNGPAVQEKIKKTTINRSRGKWRFLVRFRAAKRGGTSKVSCRTGRTTVGSEMGRSLASGDQWKGKLCRVKNGVLPTLTPP